MLVFLDFDGVLRRLSSSPKAFDADCVDHFESAIRKHAAAFIVISSSWRVVIPLPELRSYFSSDVGARILGVTPQAVDDRPHVRYREIRAYLKLRSEVNTPWIAIDDHGEHFPENAPLLLTDANRGFDTECADKLTAFLGSPYGSWNQIRAASSEVKRRKAETRFGLLLSYSKALGDRDH
jgi:hypothetical protein